MNSRWSNEDIDFWEDCLIKLKPKQGRVISLVECKLILCCLFSTLQETKGTITDCAAVVSKRLRVGLNSITRAYKQYTLDLEVKVSNQILYNVKECSMKNLAS